MTDTKNKTTKNASGLANKSEAELIKAVDSKREELRKFRFESSGSKVKNVKLGKAIRREIAQNLTEINSRKIAKTK